MIITDNIDGQIYRKLIRYALYTSDAVMMVITNKPRKIVTAKYSREQWEEYLPNIPIPCEVWKNWEEREAEMKQNNAIYNTGYHLFVSRLSPYMIQKRHNTVWPTRMAETKGELYTVALYRACEELYPLLVMPKAYTAWNYPYYPEDLCFFYEGKCWLAGCSHEGYVEFYPRNQEDYNTVKAMGISLNQPYVPVGNDEWFYEEYDINNPTARG